MQLLIALALSGVPAAPQEDGIAAVTLLIGGVHTDDDGRTIGQALGKVPNAKVATVPTVQRPEVYVAPLTGAKYDVGDLAKAVTKADTPNRTKGAPTATLMLRYKLKSGTTAEDMERDFKTCCTKPKGVVADKCRFDAEAKKIYIRLSDDGGAKLADIKAAFPGLELFTD